VPDVPVVVPGSALELGIYLSGRSVAGTLDDGIQQAFGLVGSMTACLLPSQHAGRRSASDNCFWGLLRTCFQFSICGTWRTESAITQQKHWKHVFFWKWTVPCWKNSKLAEV